MQRGALIAALLLVAVRLDGALAGTPSTVQAEASPRALEVIDACISRLDAEVDVGFRRIAARCPDLAPTLAGGGFDRWLPRTWRDPENDLSAGGLEEMRQLLARELTMRPLRRTPSTERLRQELARLGSQAPPRTGVWGALASWLRRVAGRREGSPVSRRLGRLLRRVELAPATARRAASAALGGLIALAVLIVVNELRVAGALRAPTRHSVEPPWGRAAAGLAGAASDEAAELADQPRLLLGLILERLGRLRGLTGLGSLTARELIRAVQLEDPEAARQLSRLALTAERVRYAPAPASSGELLAAVDGARSLLGRLEAR